MKKKVDFMLIIMIMCFAIIAVIFVTKRETPTEVNHDYKIITVKKESKEIKTEIGGIIEIKKSQDVKINKNLIIREINYDTGDKINQGDVIAVFSAFVNKSKDGKNYKTGTIRRYVSSFDGYIMKMNLLPGEKIPETAFTFVNAQDIKIYTQEIPVNSEKNLLIGKNIIIKFSDNEKVKAEVTSLEKVPDSDFIRGVLTVSDIKTIIKNIDKKFELEILDENKKEVFTIPLKSIIKKEQSDGTYENYVYKIDSDRKVTEKIVILGETDNGKIEVKEGLKEGDNIIINPDNKIKNGEIIKNIN